MKGGQVKALIDPGAQLSVINARLAQRKGLKVENVPDNRSTVIMANGTAAKVHRWLPALEFWVGTWLDRHPVLVIDNTPRPLLLGMDWVKKWQPTIDWVIGDMRISGCLVVWRVEEEGTTKPIVVEQVGGIEWLTTTASRKRIPVYEDPRMLLLVHSTGVEAEKNDVPIHPKVTALLTEYADLFEPVKTLPAKSCIVPKIELIPGAVPSRKPPFRLSDAHKQAITTHVSKLLEAGLIRPSSSPWATRLIVVPKKDGSMRLCGDYQPLNALTKRDGYPLPRIDDLLHVLQGYTIFSKLDLLQGYHQVRLDDESVEFTAFSISEPVCGFAHFKWLVVPFGLVNTPPFFQRLMDFCFKDLGRAVRIYMDNILIPSRIIDKYYSLLRRVFDVLRLYHLRLKRSKCLFAVPEVAFLGHWLNECGITVEEDKVKALLNWDLPLSTVRQIRQFVGLASYYRAFIPRFAELAEPLTKMTRKNALVVWTPEADRACKDIIGHLVKAPVLQSRSSSRQDRVTTNASAIGMGATFEQFDDEEGVWKPCAY